MKKEHYEKVDRLEMEEELELGKKQEKMRAKRVEQANKRKELGYMNVGEELDDPILDQLAINDAKYQKQLEE